MDGRGMIGAGSALAMLVAALVASGEPTPAVDIQLFQFQPGAVEVKAGTTTTVKFDEPGVYPYFCDRHPSMRGEIRVRPS